MSTRTISVLFVRTQTELVGLTLIKLTVDHDSDIHKVDLTASLHAGLTAVHALVCFGHMVDLQAVVCQHLEPACDAQGKKIKLKKKQAKKQTNKRSLISMCMKIAKENCHAPLAVNLLLHTFI